jgi:hypothetical protein
VLNDLKTNDLHDLPYLLHRDGLVSEVLLVDDDVSSCRDVQLGVLRLDTSPPDGTAPANLVGTFLFATWISAEL